MTPEQQALLDAMRAGAAALKSEGGASMQYAHRPNGLQPTEHDRLMDRSRLRLAQAATLTAAADRIERGEPSLPIGWSETLSNVRSANAADFSRKGASWEGYDQAVRDCHDALDALTARAQVQP